MTTYFEYRLIFEYSKKCYSILQVQLTVNGKCPNYGDKSKIQTV